jgi:nitrite reductase/ring-hydroxylating ferredoxin subunit
MRFRLSTGEAIGQLTDKPINVFETRVVEGIVHVGNAAP